MQMGSTTVGQWLTGVAWRHKFHVESPPRRRAGTWSEKLAIAMEKGPEYDSLLRRIAKGERNPNPETTYNIGKGLRAAGLAWCSGALALMRNPRTFNDLLAVMDIASRAERPGNIVAGWYFLANSGVFELPSSDVSDGTVEVCLGLLADFTSAIESTFESAFAEYNACGLRKSHGILGDAYFINGDKRLSRADEFVTFALKRWLVETRFDDEALFSRLDTSIRTASVTKSRFARNQSKKVG
jgi:hypothetical protein